MVSVLVNAQWGQVMVDCRIMVLVADFDGEDAGDVGVLVGGGDGAVDDLAGVVDFVDGDGAGGGGVGVVGVVFEVVEGDGLGGGVGAGAVDAGDGDAEVVAGW